MIKLYFKSIQITYQVLIKSLASLNKWLETKNEVYTLFDVEVFQNEIKKCDLILDFHFLIFLY